MPSVDPDPRWVDVWRDLWVHQVLPHCSSVRRCLPRTMSRWVWRPLKRRLHKLSGHPGPGLQHPQSTEVLPEVQRDPPMLQAVPMASCPDLSCSNYTPHWLLLFNIWADSMWEQICPPLPQPQCSSMTTSIVLQKQTAGKHVDGSPDPKPTANYINWETFARLQLVDGAVVNEPFLI